MAAIQETPAQRTARLRQEALAAYAQRERERITSRSSAGTATPSPSPQQQRNAQASNQGWIAKLLAGLGG